MTIEFIEQEFNWLVIGCHDEPIGKIQNDSAVGVVFQQSTYYPYWVELEEMQQILSKMKELQGGDKV